MSGLYSATDSELEQNVEETGINAAVTDVTQMLNIMDADLKGSIELTAVAVEHMAVAETINKSLRSLPLGSKEYFACLENNKSVIEILSRRMGPVKLPAMEDFKNEYALRSSHQLSLESIDGFWRRTWESIKKFFKEFFKKVTLFLKRIVNANLDLASYEQYIDKMISKMKASKPELKDNTLISSKLAGLIADKGQESIDSDFVLRTGMQKVVNLVGVINKLSTNNNSFLAKDQLRNFRSILETLVRAYSDNLDGPGAEQIDKHIADIKDYAANILTGMFTSTVEDKKQLPDMVYEKLYDDFNTTNVRSNDVTVLSLVPLNTNEIVLPKDLNMFLAHQDKKTFYVTSHKESNNYASPHVKPISNVNNLVSFYNDYKKKVQTASVEACSKSVDSAEEEIFKILDVLSSKYIKLMDTAERNDKLGGSYSLSLLRAIDKSGKAGSYFSIHDLTGDNDMDTEIHHLLMIAEDIDDTDETNLKFILEEIDDKIRGNTDYFKRALNFIDKYCGISHAKLKSANPSGEAISNFKKLQELNTFLTHVFSKLQTIFRTVVSDVLGLYTEIRYELVRYIYESCRRYSY